MLIAENFNRFRSLNFCPVCLVNPLAPHYFTCRQDACTIEFRRTYNEVHIRTMGRDMGITEVQMLTIIELIHERALGINSSMEWYDHA